MTGSARIFAPSVQCPAMTLLLTMANPKHVVLVSDRRASVNGRIADDEFNKAGVFACSDAVLTYAFTGLARYGSHRTGDWLVDALGDAATPDSRMAPAIRRFADLAEARFERLPVGLAVVLGGYAAEDPLPHIWVVTNIEDENLNLLAKPTKAFRVFHSRERAPSEPGWVLVSGQEGAVRDDDLKAIRGLVRKAKPAWGNLVDRGIVAIRRAAEVEPSVGKECMSVALLPGLVATATYHTTKVGLSTHFPDIVNAVDGVRMKGGFVQTRSPPVVPKMGRNDPCPCGSGRKYKRCHALTSGRALRIPLGLGRKPRRVAVGPHSSQHGRAGPRNLTRRLRSSARRAVRGIGHTWGGPAARCR